MGELPGYQLHGFCRARAVIVAVDVSTHVLRFSQHYLL